MATGIDYNDPRVQKGIELFEELFRDRPELIQEPSPQRPKLSPGEEKRRGMELFEQLFYDRLHPPEVSEETPEPEEPEEPDIPEEVPVPSPMRTPPRPRGPPPKTPPEWLIRTTKRSPDDLLHKQKDWFNRFYFPKHASPPSPFYKGPSPLRVDPDEEFQDEVFKDFVTPPPPEPEPEPEPEQEPEEIEPPIPECNIANSFEQGMNQMYHEVQKYGHDVGYIEEFVRIAPAVRDYEILTKEIQALVNLYLPDIDTEGLAPNYGIIELESYIIHTEREVMERYGEQYKHQYEEISEAVSAALLRVHKEKVLEAIDTYKRHYFVLKDEIDKANAELQKLQDESYLINIEWLNTLNEIKRLQDEEKIATEKYAEELKKKHYEDCFYIREKHSAKARYVWLKRVGIPRTTKELELMTKAHEEQIKSMKRWLTMFPPNLEQGIIELVYDRLHKNRYDPVPMERYMTLAETLTRDLQKKKESREADLRHYKQKCRNLMKVLEEAEAERDQSGRTLNELMEMQNNLRRELHNIRFEDKKRAGLWAQLLNEKLHVQTYNEILLGRLIILETSPSEKSEGLPSRSDPGSRTPSPVGRPPGGSGVFDINQVEPAGQPEPDDLGNERPPSGMLNISGLQGSGFSSSPDGQPEPDDLGNERPPSGMLNISGLQGSGFSPSPEWIPDDQPEPDDLGGEGLGSDMFNISGLQGSGFSSSPEDLGSEGLGSDMFNIPGLQGSGFSSSPEDLGGEGLGPDMFNISGLQGSGFSSSPEDLGGEMEGSNMFNISALQGAGFSSSPLDSLEKSKTSFKRSFTIPSPGKEEKLRLDVEVIPNDIRRSPSGQRVICDLYVKMMEAIRRPPKRELEKRKHVVRGTPPISQTVGRRFDRRYGMFTPQSSFKQHHVAARGPLFEGDFESPESPWGTGRKTHPELMNLPPRAVTPPSPNRTIEWETNPEM